MKQFVKNQLFLQQEQKWNEWFAGLVDGNGCLLLSKKGYMLLEITMRTYDERTLLRIKNKKSMDCECFDAFLNSRLYLRKKSTTHK